MRATRVTGIQCAHAGAVAMLEAWRRQLGPREWIYLVDVLSRWLEAERLRNERAARRWAA